MAAALEAALAQATTQANTATGLLNAALVKFNTYCQAGSWSMAEKARLEAISHLEAHLDGIAAVYKLLEEG